MDLEDVKYFFKANLATKWIEIPGDVDRNDKEAMAEAIENAKLDNRRRKRWFG